MIDSSVLQKTKKLLKTNISDRTLIQYLLCIGEALSGKGLVSYEEEIQFMDDSGMFNEEGALSKDLDVQS